MAHIPVLLQDVLTACEPIPFADGWFVDGTFGRGGHARALLDKFSDCRILAIDHDLDAINFAKDAFATEIKSGRMELHRGNFLNFETAIGDKKLIGMLLDLGVSSPQLDEAHRGFSFYHDGPLDMRMDQSLKVSAEDVVNTWAEVELAEIFRSYGEVPRPERAAKAIVNERKAKPFKTTGDLAKFFERLDGWRRKGHHPATNYFQAVRIAVNSELKVLEQVLPKIAERLTDSGRLLVITFHSLEDRIVKYKFRDLEESGVAFPVNKKVIQAHWNEKKINARSRSAKLRVLQKGERS